MISEDFCELIHRVPRETVDAVGVGSIAPASRLLKTLRAFEEGRARGAWPPEARLEWRRY